MTAIAIPSYEAIMRNGYLMARRLLREVSNVHRIGGLACVASYVSSIVTNAPAILQTGSLAPADQGMSYRDWTMRVFERDIVLAGQEFSGAREMFGRKVYFAMPGFRIEPGDVVVDLGANIGLFSVLAAKLGARVFAIEATAKYAADIERKAHRNDCASRVLVERGLLAPGSGALRNALNAWPFDEPPPAPVTLNDFFARHGLKRVDFMKIDIEGSEFGLFDQPLDWLSKVKRVVMEIHTDFGDVRRLQRILSKHGFTQQLLNNDLEQVSQLSESAGYLYAVQSSAPSELHVSPIAP